VLTTHGGEDGIGMLEELVVNELLAGLADELLEMKLPYNAVLNEVLEEVLGDELLAKKLLYDEVVDEVLDELLENELLAGLLDELLDMKLLYDEVVDESVDKLPGNKLVEVERINDEYMVVEDEVAAELDEDVLAVQFPRRGWHPVPQKSEVLPQLPYCEQQFPNPLPKHDTPLPQVPSLLIFVQYPKASWQPVPQ
jgi:hypothetical protein